MADLTLANVKIDETLSSEFFSKFVLECPKPNNWTGTNLEWVEEWVRQRLRVAYNRGIARTDATTGMIK